MTNYSRTTLRELKKRYLNVLKKCLLANLLAFSFVLPSMGEALETTNNRLICMSQCEVENTNFIKNGTFENHGSAVHISTGGNMKIKSNVSFIQNKANNGIIVNTDKLTISGTNILFSKNEVTGVGAGIYNTGELTFEQGSEVTFSNNNAKTGAGIYNGHGIVNIAGKVDFFNNTAQGISAMASTGGEINFYETANVQFKDNISNGLQGALFVTEKGIINIYSNAHIAFIDNSGIGMHSNLNSSINIGRYTNMVFSGNGIALYAAGGNLKMGVDTIISDDKNLSNLKHVSDKFVNQYVFENNGQGLAILGETLIGDNTEMIFKNNSKLGLAVSKGSITFGKNNKISFIGNYRTEEQGGGAFFAPTSTFTSFGVGSEVLFQQNKAYWNGGGFYNNGTQVDFYGKSDFIKNLAVNGHGGGILTYKGHTTFNQDTIVTFIGNTAKQNGGGIRVWSGIVTFLGDAVFDDNKTNLLIDEKNNSIISYSKNDIDIIAEGVINFSSGSDKVVSLSNGFTGDCTAQINKSGTGLLVLGDNSENHEYQGTFTQTAGVTIANSEAFFSHELAQNTINGGELKTHGAEIAYKATLGETGTLTHLGTSADTPTEIKGVSFNGTGLNLTLGTYTKAEQEKEIALVGDRLVEYVDDKGTEDTADDELVSYQATDKLFTVKALENDQKAKFILNENLVGMEGNSITVAGAELDVKEGLKVAGKVIAKDMHLPAEKTSSFTTLEVAEKGLLDIQNQTVTADTLSLNQEGAVKVSVHSLSDYGQILAKETVSKGAGTLTMNLVGAPQEGVYKVFESDTDLKLATTHEFFDIADLENGSYKIARKKANELAEKFGLNEEETRAVSAVIGGNSENEAFQKVQTEIMETLKFGNKVKAKKALSAVGSKEHPVEQSVASEHLVALQNVVQAELHGTTVGHSGGDTDPRAKVYIKGLYDRTKSSMGEGFRARSKGAVLGVQSEVTEDLSLGVGYATSQTTAKEDLRRTEVDTNTGFISVHYQPNAWWVSGLATFSRGEYEEEKQVLSSMGKASYNVDSWGAQVMTGYDIKLEKAIITPEVGLRYLSVKQEGYTDTLGTTVSGTQSDYLTALVGVKGVWNMGAIRPTAGVTVGYDIISDDVSALNTLANGASYTVNGEALDRLSTTVTTGVEADLGDRTTLKLEYSGTYRKEYVDHSGMLKLEMKF